MSESACAGSGCKAKHFPNNLELNSARDPSPCARLDAQDNSAANLAEHDEPLRPPFAVNP